MWFLNEENSHGKTASSAYRSGGLLELGGRAAFSGASASTRSGTHHSTSVDHGGSASRIGCSCESRNDSPDQYNRTAYAHNDQGVWTKYDYDAADATDTEHSADNSCAGHAGHHATGYAGKHTAWKSADACAE